MIIPSNNPYTYNIICPNGKRYYGYRSANKVRPEEDLWKVYFTSSDPVKELRIQYNDDSLFVATVDKIFETADEAREYEEKFLTENGCVKSDDWLNRANGGKEFCTPEHISEKHKRNLSIAHRGRKHTEEHKRNNSIAHMGLKHTEKSKKKMSIAKKGKKHTEEHRRNNSIAQMGKKLSDATKKKISIALKGRKLSDKHIKNVSIANKRRRGIKLSKESIEKRTATRRKNGWNKKDRI